MGARWSVIAWLCLVAGCAKASVEREREAAIQLEVRVDGAATTTWHQEDFDQTPIAANASRNSDGDERATWSLRELVTRTYGAHARVVAIVGDSTKTIGPAEWNDPERTPIVHKTRRGNLNFCWADAAGTWGETQVKHMTAVEVVR